MLTRVAEPGMGPTTRGLLLAALCLLVLLLSSAAGVQAQIYYGTITGTVTDSSNAVVGGATITVKSLARGDVYTATTSDSGVYNVAQLPVGTYEVRVAQKGFKEFVATSVEVHTSSDTRVDAQLELGAATETVQVEATDIQVETTSGAVGNVIEGTQVRELPLNGENFMGLVPLTPGVSVANSFNQQRRGIRPHHPRLSVGGHDRGIQDDHQLLRAGIWPGGGFDHQYHHEVGNEPVPRRGVLCRAQRCAGRQRLVFELQQDRQGGAAA